MLQSLARKEKARGIAGCAMILGLGGLFAKLLGAFYRIPLTALLGGEGMGIYQLVFPIYTFLLVLSSGGIPSAIAHLGAEAPVREGHADFNVGDVMKIAQQLIKLLVVKFDTH